MVACHLNSLTHPFIGVGAADIGWVRPAPAKGP